ALYEDGGVGDQLGDQGLSKAVTASGNALEGATDVDDGDQEQLVVSGIRLKDQEPASSTSVNSSAPTEILGTYGALTMAANGIYTYTLYGADSDYYGALNALGHNQPAEETFIFTVSDGNGGTADANLSFAVKGSNDRPVIEEVEVAPQFEDKVEVEGQVKASDADGDATAFTFSFGIIETDDPETLGISAALRTAIEKGFTGETDGKWSLNLPSAELDFLSADSSLTIQVLVEANDEKGQANSVGESSFTITINGQNDAPTVSPLITLVPDEAVLASDGAQAKTPLFNLIEEGGASDPDGDPVTLVTETLGGSASISLANLLGGQGDTSIDLQIPIETLIGAGVITVNANGSFEMDAQVATVLQDLLGSGDSMQLAGTFGVTDGTATTPGNFDVEILGDGGAEDHTGIAEYSDDNVPTFLSPNELSGNDSEVG
ncbi:VCBS domain-containing protein, partial [Limimaricola soesokkakensis]|uniref:VCBS domain-containing protein n=1 Tax=Limimaricola soesokkakensis TaxID=1343159 RepID=UPI0035185171